MQRNRRIIDAIEGEIELGKSVNEAIHSILGKICEINDDSGEIEVAKVKIGKSSLKLKSMNTSCINF